MTLIDRSASVPFLRYYIVLASIVIHFASAQQETYAALEDTSGQDMSESSPTEQDMAPSENNNEDDGLSAGAKTGIAISIIILFILAILLCIKCRNSPDRDIKSIDTKDTEDPLCDAELGSHNTHAIDVHRCISASCTECGNKIDSPVKFLPANGSKDVEEILEDAEPNDGFEEVDIGDDLEVATVATGRK